MPCLMIKFNCNFYVKHFGKPGRNADVSVDLNRILIRMHLGLEKGEFLTLSI